MNQIVAHSAILTAAFGLALTATAATPALAAGDAVTKRGSCSDSSSWKLKAKPDNGRLEVEGETDTNRNGQMWHWKILHNGEVAKKGMAMTTAPSGSFSVTRRVNNAAGTDRIGWRATNPNTGETCRGSLSI
jgi:hypothetical protein